jgi:hypothetical protein
LAAGRQRDVERDDESEVQPVGAAQRNALAEGSAYPVRRNKHPLGARNVRATQRRELLDEWIHAISVCRLLKLEAVLFATPTLVALEDELMVARIGKDLAGLENCGCGPRTAGSG